MEGTRTFASEIQELLDSGVLRPSADDLVIDTLAHRSRQGTGFHTLIYFLRLEVYEEGRITYEIVESSRESGDDVVLSTDDPDEAANGITNLINEMKE